jgi:hypothetical protein
MAGKSPDTAQCVSRRGFFFTAVGGGVAIAGADVFTFPALASSKMSQNAVSYQPAPKGNRQCSNCLNFEAPTSCKLVDGTISPSGWCTIYVTKK